MVLLVWFIVSACFGCGFGCAVVLVCGFYWLLCILFMFTVLVRWLVGLLGQVLAVRCCGFCICCLFYWCLYCFDLLVTWYCLLICCVLV